MYFINLNCKNQVKTVSTTKKPTMTRFGLIELFVRKEGSLPVLSQLLITKNK